jgi:hypothetical protein
MSWRGYEKQDKFIEARSVLYPPTRPTRWSGGFLIYKTSALFRGCVLSLLLEQEK